MSRFGHDEKAAVFPAENRFDQFPPEAGIASAGDKQGRGTAGSDDTDDVGKGLGRSQPMKPDFSSTARSSGVSRQIVRAVVPRDFPAKR
jgi:hypothetical protein